MPADTRDRIVAEAARLFQERGFDGAGVASILRAAEVNSGSLYHFFASKEALLAGVVERYLDLLGPTLLEPAERATSDPVERVFGLLDQYRLVLVSSGFGRGCPIGELALEVGSRMPRIRGLIERYFSVWLNGVRGWLAAAGDRLPAGLDRDGLARLVLATMEGGVMQARTAGRIEPFDAAVAQLRSHLEMLKAGARQQRGAAVPETAIDTQVPSPPEGAPPTEQATDWRSW